jgi:drug/metabolite transporter (DMT)-like permease
MGMMFSLVLGGAFLWGVGNVVQSHYLKGLGVHEDVATVAITSGSVVFALGAEIIWNGVPRVQTGFWWPFIATALLNVVSTYWNVKASKLEDISIVSSLAATMPMFVIVMSWVLLREWPTFYGRIAIFCIAFGSYLFYLKGQDIGLPIFLARVLPRKTHQKVILFGAPWLRLFSSKGARLALATAYVGAVSVNYDKLAILNSSPMLLTAGAYLVVAVFIYGWSNAMGRWGVLDKQHFGKLFGLGLWMGLVTILVNAGYLYGIVPYVGTLKRTQIFWTVLFAGIFLKEKYTGIRLVGAAAIFIGTILVAF